MPQSITLDQILSSYDIVLLDAYGVMVTSRGAVEGAASFLERLRDSEQEFFVVTNDASRLPETCARHYESMGLGIEASRILTSGMLLQDYFADQGLEGSRCVVLGPPDSVEYVRRAGGEIVEPDLETPCEVVVVGDESGFPFLETLDIVLSMLMRRFSRGHDVHLLVPNPDLLYPKGYGEFGFASGAIASMFEAALQVRFPDQCPRFTRLGKPHGPIFEAARRRAGEGEMLMIGDQLATDIRGACEFGIDSVLVGTGITDPEQDLAHEKFRPTYFVESLARCVASRDA